MNTFPSNKRLVADANSASLRSFNSPPFSSTPRPFGDSRLATPSFSEKKQGADLDPEVYSAGQSLASILNNPHLGKAGIYGSDASWGAWFFSSSTDVQDTGPSTPLKPLPEVSRADFQTYLDSISDSYGRFADVREHSNWERSNQVTGFVSDDNVEGEAVVQGEGLVACLREIPSLYFSEDFALEDGSTFQAACPYSSIPQNMMLQEKLSHYLDIVEFHLVKEIAARSESFFEAQGQLEDLNSDILRACEQIRGLKGVVRLSDVHVVESAQRIQCLSEQRDNLLSLHQKLKLMSYVNQALSDLPLLVAAADCGGALDVIDVLQHLLESDELVGLHSFRHLGDQLAYFVDSVNSMLAADFVRVAIHGTKDLESSVIIAKFRRRDLAYITNAKDDFLIEENNEKEDEEAGLRDQLLPIVIGLLRTSKVPAVLRVYRDTLITDIKAAIKVVVAELLSVLITRPLDTDVQSGERQVDMEGGGISLASKLRGLSADSFVQLLTGVFDVIQVRLLRAAEVRRVIEQIVGGLQGSYAEAAVAAAFASGAAAAAAAEAAAEAAQEDQMHSVLPVQAQKTTTHYGLSLSGGIEAPSPTTISRNFRADVLRENTEAVCSACHAAHERWAKLLGVRALIHPKLRLQEFVNIHSITQVFMLATEKIGGRYASSIRGTLHSQSKAFVDVQHNIRMSKISAVLEQETWVSIDAPDEFQTIADLFIYSEPLKDGILSTEEAAVSSDSEKSDQVLNKMSSAELAEEVSNVDSSKNPVRLLSRHNSFVSSKHTIDHTEEHRENHRSDFLGHLDESQRAPGVDVINVQPSPHEDAGIANGVRPKSEKTHLNAQTEDGAITDASVRSRKGREKPSVKTLQIRGVGFHMVNSGLILLKMIAEYMDISTALPSLASEVVHRVAELLKLYNSRTCQLVLGAGAMQVSGLKSITAKHLALASQSISFFHVLIADLKIVLAAHIPDARKALLLTDIDRVAQDYKVHRDEIHLKLVQIMKERLLVHLRTLPQIVETWNKSDDQDAQPSQFARALTKEVGVLHRVLSPLLLESDVCFIFTHVVALFHSQLAEAFSKLDLNSHFAKQRLYWDIQHILACLNGLPSDAVNRDGVKKLAELDEFLQRRYGNGTPD